MSTPTLIHGYRPGTLREATNCDWCLTEPRFRGSVLCEDHELDYRVHNDPTLKACTFPLNAPLRAYKLGCRCDRCKTAKSGHDRRMKAQRRG